MNDIVARRSIRIRYEKSQYVIHVDVKNAANGRKLPFFGQVWQYKSIEDRTDLQAGQICRQDRSAGRIVFMTESADPSLCPEMAETGSVAFRSRIFPSSAGLFFGYFRLPSFSGDFSGGFFFRPLFSDVRIRTVFRRRHRCVLFRRRSR